MQSEIGLASKSGFILLGENSLVKTLNDAAREMLGLGEVNIELPLGKLTSICLDSQLLEGFFSTGVTDAVISNKTIDKRYSVQSQYGKRYFYIVYTPVDKGPTPIRGVILINELPGLMTHDEHMATEDILDKLSTELPYRAESEASIREAIVAALKRLFKPDQVVIYSMPKGPSVLAPATQLNTHEGRCSPTDMESCPALARGSMFMVNDRSNEMNCPKQPEVNSPQSYICMPITAGDIKLGVIYMHSRKPNAFPGEMTWALVKVAQKAAVSLLNAKKFEDAQAQAITDYLTGIYNRRFFMETLEKTHAISKRHNNFYSLILIDVDHFKYLNDSHGHLTGDQSLKDIANVLKKSIRSSDTLGRIGGDEFAILLPQTGIEAGVQVAEKLRIAIESSFSRGNEVSGITISAGVSTYRSTYTDVTAETVFSTADKAMYEAKRSGRNAVASVDFGVANPRNAETNVT